MIRGILLLAAAVAVLASLMVPAGASDAVSETELSDGAVYRYETFGSGYPGYRSEISSVSTGSSELYIASALEGHEVVSVGGVSGPSLESAVVPASVRSLEAGAFDGCPVLRTVFFLGDRPDMPDGAVPEGVAVLRMPGASGWGDEGLIGTDVAVSGDGSSVTYALIGGAAMAVSGSPSPEGAVHIASSAGGLPVESIGPSAFAGGHDDARTDIVTVDIADGVGIIRERAFFYCGGLVSASIPGSATAIMDEAFRAASSLRDADIPPSVEYLGFECFRDCASLPSIDIPDSVGFMGEGAFKLCRGAESIVAGSGLRDIPVMAFAYADSARTVEMRGSPASVGDSAFLMCSSLEAASLPDGVLSLGRSAFLDCRSMGSVDLGASLESIGDWCFQGCSSLSSVTVPASVVSIGDKAFAYCPSLEDAFFEGDMPEFGSGVFLNDDVAVHCTEARRGSWSGFEGVVVDGEEGIRWAAPAVAAAVLAAICALIVRRRTRRCRTAGSAVAASLFSFEG